MFAIVQLGNQQFQVKAGDFVRAPYQDQPLNKKFDLPVLAFGSESDFVCDSSLLKKSRVQALVIRQSRSKKALVFKKKRRKGYRRTHGHRQKITEIRVLELKSPSGQVSKVEIQQTAPSKSKAKRPLKKTTSLAKKAPSEKSLSDSVRSLQMKTNKKEEPKK